MIPLSECAKILNDNKEKKRYTENEVKIIRDFLIRMSEIELLQYHSENTISKSQDYIKTLEKNNDLQN